MKLQACRHVQNCFPVKFVKFLRNVFLQNTCGGSFWFSFRVPYWALYLALRFNLLTPQLSLCSFGQTRNEGSDEEWASEAAALRVAKVGKEAAKQLN